MNTRREVLPHALKHGSGIAACVAVLPWLIFVASAHGDTWRLVGGLSFGLSALFLFVASTLYHSVIEPQATHRLRILDHCAIYLLIAGTYTPFAIGVLGGTWGWMLFGIVWAVAVLGIAAKLTLGVRFSRPSTIGYLVMGCSGLIAARPLYHALSQAEALWLLDGGIAYTAGVPFYLWTRQRYSHTARHLMVLVGICCHFVAVLDVVSAPSRTARMQ